MPRAFWLFLSVCGALFAENRFELIAASVESENNVTVAEGDVSLRGEDGAYMRADRLIYCQDTGEAELFGNVYFSRIGGDLMLADYLKLQNANGRDGMVDHFFTVSNKSPLWLAGNEAIVDGNISTIKQGSVSGCAPASPDWSFRFSEARHDQEKQWVEIRNAVFYAGRVPVFYMPFFGYYTDDKRRSGFLFPRFGSSKDDGTRFELPFYLAPSDWWDLEFWDQARYKRGDGLGLYFRWVDSPYSKGAINLGRFKNKQEYLGRYVNEREVKQGGDLIYERSRIFTSPSSNTQEGLIIDYQDYNDIEYIDLHSLDGGKLDRDIGALITNKADYFLKGDDAYLGVYSRYFKNYKNPLKNDALAQILPEAHGHLFARSLFFDNLLISADARARNFTRKEGNKAQDYEIDVPISYHLPLFDDYLLFDAKLETSRYQIRYLDQIATKLESGIENRQTLTLGLSTLLAKPYNDVFHTIGFSASLSDPFYHSVTGDFDRDFTDAGAKQSGYKTASLNLTQFLYDKRGRAFLTHRANQIASIEDNASWFDLENELTLKLFDQSLTNKLRYSHDLSAVVSSVTDFSGSISDFEYALTHLYENPTGKQVAKRYMQASIGYRLSANDAISGRYERDLLENQTRGWRVALNHKSGCWQSELSFERATTPYNVGSRSSSSKINDIIYLRLILIPFGEVSQQLYANEKS
ncbi:MAG: LPS assembly protein LptD [Helicobacteraceae bacterium]|jgi:LPS-assembly protein|nr:LPS assembly protein LptD [Helicobacteraceae bacterium]